MNFNARRLNDTPGNWCWGQETLPVVPSYTYLGVEFTSDCQWSTHIRNIVEKAKKKVAGLYQIFRNRHLTMDVKRTAYLHLIRPCLEYAASVWVPNSSERAKLESVQLSVLKSCISASSKTASVAVRGDFGVTTLQARRNLAKILWLFRLSQMGHDRYPAKVESVSWGQTCPGKQARSWQKVVDTILDTHDICKQDLTEMADAEEVVAQLTTVIDSVHKEQEDLERSQKSDLKLFDCFSEPVGFKTYLMGKATLGTRLKFKLRAGSIPLAAKMRHMRPLTDGTCPLCQSPLEDSVHFLLHCNHFAGLRKAFMAELGSLVGVEKILAFKGLEDVSRAAALLSDQFWDPDTRAAVDQLIKRFLENIWQSRINQLYAGKSVYKDEPCRPDTPPLPSSLSPSLCAPSDEDAGSMADIATTSNHEIYVT